MTTRHNLAAVRSRASAIDRDDSSVLELLRENLAEHIRLRGPMDPQALGAAGLLAEHLQHRGDHDAAIELLELLVDQRTEVLGTTAAPTITSRRMLAESFRIVGRIDDAVETATAARSMRRRLLGRHRSRRSKQGLSWWPHSRQRHGTGLDVSERRAEVVAALAAVDLGFLETDHPVRLEIETILRQSG
ncbi:MAG: tetratricopeptide repeat protein [Microthrixaceae bacterium]